MSARLAAELSDIVEDIIGSRLSPAYSGQGNVCLELSRNDTQVLVDRLRKVWPPLFDDEPPDETEEEPEETWTYLR